MYMRCLEDRGPARRVLASHIQIQHWRVAAIALIRRRLALVFAAVPFHGAVGVSFLLRHLSQPLVRQMIA